MQVKNYQAAITFWQESVNFTFIHFWDDYSTSFTESSKFSDEWLLTFRIGDSFLRIFHLNGKFAPENHYQIGWFSHEGHSFESYYYTTINDNNATALGLSTVVISQKALMVVQHCRLSYVREHVSHCFLLFLYVSPIYVTEQNVFLLHSTGKTSQRHFEGLFMM